VRVRVVEAKKRWARAELVEVVRESPQRVTAPCPLASGACGGCPWMHVAPDAQVAAKQAIAAGALRGLIARGMVLGAPLAPVAPLRWRRRARYAWSAPPLRIGFRGHRSHAIADAPVCLQVDERIERAVARFRDEIGPRLVGRGELHVLVGHAGDVDLVLDGADAELAAATRALGGGPSRRVEVEPGQWAAADDFAQASGEGNAALIDEVLAAVAPQPGLRVLELFAGSGNFTRHLLDAGASVVANDVAISAIAGARLESGPAHQALARVGGEGFDVLLLDPPRTGAAEVVEAVRALGAAAPPRIVYVSCDAATLARDLERLADAGYAPRHARVLDLFPQTAHLEIVVSATLGP
jgi:23S rRNA (uracil1939-C5)-methyltransferase